jgi:hypothetical protein
MIEYKVKVYGEITEWYLNGKLHREDGPAIEYKNGDKSWWLNGNLHREGGPAIIRANGNKLWWKTINCIEKMDLLLKGATVLVITG